YDGATMGDFPSGNPWASDAFHCGLHDPIDPSWERLLTTPSTSGTSSIFLDRISNLRWSKGPSPSSRYWANGYPGSFGALEYCENMNHGGISNWRMPSQKELLNAYEHGIQDLSEDNTPTNNLGPLDSFHWALTSPSSGTAVMVQLDEGLANQNGRSSYSTTICVAD
ncbi:DUF1566 domain-containing protein, partial [Oligoflexaceae bacterium]|nr:DUF1566 domain-containing protein [Oligoflexaceae bacterium]